MVIRTIANKVGTIEVDENSLYFLQPLSTFKTHEMEHIHQAYERKMSQLTEKTNYLPARNITFQSGQVQFEYDMTDLVSFDYLKSLYLEDKLPYYLSLLQIARDKDVRVLWQKENFVLNVEEKEVKAVIIGYEVFDLHNHKNPVNAVKELIIISLTHLNRVLERPRRTDFFEQDETVIRFAEMVYLRLHTLDGLEAYVSRVYEEVTERRLFEEEEHKALEAKKNGFSFKNISFPVKWKTEMKDDDKQQLLSNKSKMKKPLKAADNNENKLRLLIGAGAILLAALVVNMLLTNTNEKAEANQTSEQSSQEDIQESLKAVYRQGLLGDQETVIQALESIGYDALTEEDQEVLTTLYMEKGEYQKVLEHNPEAAGGIAAKLSEEKQIEELKALQASLKTPNPNVDFEIAIATEDWQRAIDQQNLIELTDTRLNNLVTAFLNSGDIQSAKAFVSEKATDNEALMDRILKAEKQQNELIALQEEKARQQSMIDTETNKKKIETAKKRLKELEEQMKKLNESIKHG